PATGSRGAGCRATCRGGATEPPWRSCAARVAGAARPAADPRRAGRAGRRATAGRAARSLTGRGGERDRHGQNTPDGASTLQTFHGRDPRSSMSEAREIDREIAASGLVPTTVSAGSDYGPSTTMKRMTLVLSLGILASTALAQ